MFDVCTMQFDKVLQYQVMETFIVLDDKTHLKISTSFTGKFYCILTWDILTPGHFDSGTF